MPARSLSAEPCPAHSLSIVGRRSRGSGGFVEHVGLLSLDSATGQNRQQNCCLNTIPDVLHVRLTERRGVKAAVVNEQPTTGFQVIGWQGGEVCQPFTADDIDLVAAFLLLYHDDGVREVDFEYVAHPPYAAADAVDGHTLLRMSCVGLVLRIFEVLRRPLLQGAGDPERQTDYPAYTWSELISLYPFLGAAEQHRRRLGFPPEQETYRAIFPGYVFHALDAVRDALAYSPQRGHTDYPLPT
jgi:hypothetical protein